jgi:hypothetical protein
MSISNGHGSGYDSSDGSGSGHGNGHGHGSGSGFEEERLQIELNILSHIPDSDLPLFMGEWEFDKTEKIFEEQLKGYDDRKTC